MGSLAVPLVLWGRDPPTHDISCILLTKDVKTLITASRDGQICVWDFDPPKLKMTPRVLLVGHSAAVTCLAQGSTSSSAIQTVVSASENGEFCTWDLSDGRCLEVVTSHNIHNSITPYQMLNTPERRLFTTGNYPEIHVYDAISLQLLCSLTSRLQPDWLAAIHVLRPSKRTDEVVLGVTRSGWVKVWTVSEQDVSGGENIKEHESKRIRAPDARCLVCCAYNQRTVLLVTPTTWQIYDAGDFSQLTSYSGVDRDLNQLEHGPRLYSGGSFLSNDTVLLWGDTGVGYIYKLPNNCVVGTKEFHKKQIEGENPILIGICKPPRAVTLVTPPSWQFQTIPVQSGAEKLLVRGDCEGSVLLWRIMDLPQQQMKQLLSVRPVQPLITKVTIDTSLLKAWKALDRPPVGLLDHIGGGDGGGDDGRASRVCATLFLGSQGRVACGREDGSILLLPATDAIMLHLLHTEHSHGPTQSMVLRGHQGRVTCLLYPHGDSGGVSGSGGRYPPNQLVSGGADFAVIVWDLCTGAQVQRFVVQAGPVLQLMVTPQTCSVRVQHCIVSLSADHSVALISLKELRVVLLAAHQPCPVTAVRWRPLHDFLVIATQDGAVHVWQMDTGHLDRVVTGVVAEEILAACDELGVGAGGAGMGSGGDGTQGGLANPAIHLLRGLRHRNLAAIRHAAQRGIQQVLGEQNNEHDIHDTSKLRCCPLLLQPLRTHPSDPHSHVLFVDIEALIVQLLADEYATMSPGSLEESHLTHTSHYHRISLLTHPASPEAAKKIAEFFGKVKDKAGEMEKKMKDKDKHDLIGRALDKAASSSSSSNTAVKESVPGSSERDRYGSGLISRVKESAGTVQYILQSKVDQSQPQPLQMENDMNRAVDVPTQTLQIGQLVMSVLHSWGLDPALDNTCVSLLGLLRPKVPPAFGLVTKSGFMSLFLPTWHPVKDSGGPPPTPPPDLAQHLPKEMMVLQHATQVFSSRGHWEISSAVTTQHLLALVALANTLQHRNAATLAPPRERRRRAHILTSKSSSTSSTSTPSTFVAEQDGAFRDEQSRVKHGWSTLTALHSVLLPEAVAKAGASAYCPPLLEILARRWQNRCQEVRDAAQVLLKTELTRIGRIGRQQLCQEWSPHLPTHTDPLPAQTTKGGGAVVAVIEGGTVPNNTAVVNGTNNSTAVVNGGNTSNGTAYTNSSNDKNQQQNQLQQQLQQQEANMMEDYQFDEDNLEGVAPGAADCHGGSGQPPGSGKGGGSGHQGVAIILLAVIGAHHGHDAEEGFGLGSSLALRTSKALAHLLLSPPFPRLPLHTPLRRAAIDLIGRGFPVWEPYLDVAKVVLALLELCADTNHLAPSMKYGLPLVPEADSCRTASHALSHIGSARPGMLITTMAREVARYNTLQQNAQSLQMNLHLTTLFRAKTEILRLMEFLIQNHRASITQLMVEVMDIILHCVDSGHLRGGRPLSEVFPAVCGFPQVSHCTNTRRIATGAHNGTIALYDLRHSKCQNIPAHNGVAVTAVAFSPDGKHLTSYSMAENKLSFWQTSSGIFGLGASQTKCTKTFSTAPVPDIVRLNPQRFPKLVWISTKTVVLMMADGTEHRFNA